MAITKLLRIKETSGRSKTIHLKNNIYYICKNEKTDFGKWIGGNAGTTPEQILKTMKRNKQFWNKESGSQAFHYMLSFPPEENISEELAMQITQEFCKELLGDEYFHVIAIHNDREHIHSHITFDSVNRMTGRKFHSPKGDWERRIQPITDRLCEKYHLPTLQYDPEKRKGKNYKEWESQKAKHTEDGSNRNKYSWFDIMRDDIDEAILKTDTWEGFLEYLKEQKYEVTRNGKYLSLKPFGKEDAVRSFRLGEGYSKEEIMKRIENNKETEKISQPEMKTYGDRVYVSRILKMKKMKNKNWKLTPYQKRFYRKWYFTYFIRKPEYSQAWKYKKDILRVEKLAEQLAYVIDHDIQTFEDIQKRSEELQKQQKKIWVRKKSEMRDEKYPDLFYQMVEYQKIQNELEAFPCGTRKDLEEELKRMEREIEKVLPMDQAIGFYDNTKEQIDYYNVELKILKKEIGILKKLVGADLEVSEMGKEYQRYGAHTRITINEKLFASNFEDSETYTTRIPYSKNFVKFEKRTCQLQNDGTILSVYIYDEKEYTVIEAGGEEKIIAGKELKRFYEDKTRERDKTEGSNSKLNL